MTSLVILAMVGGLLRHCDADRTFHLEQPIQAFAVSADGTLFAVSRDTNWIDIHDATTGKVRHSVRMSDGDRVVILAFSPDGRHLVSGAWYNPSVRVFDTKTGEEEFLLSPQTKDGGGETRALAFSPDGKVVALGQTDGQARLLDLEARKVVTTFDERSGRDGFVTGLAFHPSGSSFAAVSSYDTLGHIWSVDSSRSATAFEAHDVGHGAEGHSVLFTSDGRSVVVASRHGLSVIEAATGAVRATVAVPCQSLSAIALAPDGRHIAGVDPFQSRVVIVDLETGAAVRQIRWPFGRALGVKFAAGKLFVAGFEGSVRVFDRPILPPKLEAAPISTAQRTEAWATLGGADASAAYRAIRTLSRDPAEVLPRIREALKPVARPGAELQDRVSRLVRTLGDDDFDRRESAFRELRRLAPQVETELIRAERVATDPEVKWRLDRIRQSISNTRGREAIREIRLLELLERIRTAEARAIVAALKTGDPDAALTRDARETWIRMQPSAK